MLIVFINTSCYASNILKEVKSYIKNIKSVAIEFTQEDTNQNIAKGMLIIDKPYKFRCNYYEPFPLLIVGNKNYVSVYDFEMENLSRIKSTENIFYFLLVDDVNFEKKFEVISAKEQNNNYILKLKNAELNKISEITFNKTSKHIVKMKIYEENNTITLKFDKTIKLASAKKKLFIMQDPDIFDKPKRLDKKKLQSYFKVTH